MKNIVFTALILLFLGFSVNAGDTVEVQKKARVYDVNPYQASLDSISVKEIGKLNAGDKVLLKKVEARQWCYVELPDKTKGYLYIGNIKPSESEIVFLKQYQLLYTDTLCKKSVTTEFPGKLRVKILKREGRFSYVELSDGEKGWIFNERLEANENVVGNVVMEKMAQGFEAIRQFGHRHWTLSILTFLLFWIIFSLIPAPLLSIILFKYIGRITLFPNWLLYIVLFLIIGPFILLYVSFCSNFPPYYDHGIWLLVAGAFSAYLAYSIINHSIRHDRCPHCNRIQAGSYSGKSNEEDWTSVQKTTYGYTDGHTDTKTTRTYNHTWKNNYTCRFCGQKWGTNEGGQKVTKY